MVDTQYERAWMTSDWNDKREMIRQGWNQFLAGEQSLVALVSDHYSAATTAASYEGGVWKLRQYVYGAIAATLALIAYSQGVQNYEAGELDVLQSAFRKAGMEAHALSCIDAALNRNLDYDHHTPALLLLSKAEILADKNRGFEAERIIREGVLPRDISDTPQYVRILKNAARIFRKTGSEKEYERLKSKALRLAENEGLEDQVSKIQAI